MKLFKRSEGIARKISESYKVTNFLTKELSENISVAISEANNHFEDTKNIRSDRVYYVLEGKLKVKINDKEVVAEVGDMIFIPKNTAYHFEGTFKAILINTPAFRREDENISKL